MAALEHVELVREGRAAVDAWHADPEREEEALDLAGADLAGVELAGIDLRGANLTGADLRGSDLRYARLSEAVFCSAQLANAQLDRADLRGAIFSFADLQKARFDSADLSNADFTDSKSLFGWQLRGACVTGAKLPGDIRDFEPLNHVEELTRASRRLFLTKLAACSYAGLTIATTTDPQLLLNSSSSTLPILNASVPIVGFYYVAPIVLCAVFLYLCLYLQRLWESLSDLPAEFPDGIALDKKAHPWLLSGLMRCHVPNLRRWRMPLSETQARLAMTLAYGVVPATLFALWLRCLPRHDLLLSCVQAVMVALAVAGTALFRRLCRATLRGEDLWRPRDRKEPLPESRMPRISWATIQKADRGARRALGSTLAVLLAFSALASFRAEWVLAWDSTAARSGLLPFAPASLVSLSLEREKLSDDSTVGVDLAGRDLRAAYAPGVILRGASLEGADLAYAVLRGADLREANLRMADLRGADLRAANLEDADLAGARLDGAIRTE